jgi:hypothetical protein
VKEQIMLTWFVVLWVVGLLTFVPYGTYYLFFEAQRDQYALLFTGVLFWIFGYWSLVGPLLAISKVRRVFRAIEKARTPGKLREILQSRETEDVAIDFIASENKIPRFLAAKVYRLLVEKLASQAAKDGGRTAARERTDRPLP